jgi:hypothetical protein
VSRYATHSALALFTILFLLALLARLALVLLLLAGLLTTALLLLLTGLASCWFGLFCWFICAQLLPFPLGSTRRRPDGCPGTPHGSCMQNDFARCSVNI